MGNPVSEDITVKVLCKDNISFSGYCIEITQMFSDPPSAIAERAEVLGGDDCYVELVCNAYGNLIFWPT